MFSLGNTRTSVDMGHSKKIRLYNLLTIYYKLDYVGSFHHDLYSFKFTRSTPEQLSFEANMHFFHLHT